MLVRRGRVIVLLVVIAALSFVLVHIPLRGVLAEDMDDDGDDDDDDDDNAKCERLSTTLTYTQDKAPKDLSTVLPLIVEKVNSELDGVVDVEVGWTGKSHTQVGHHVIRCSVTRLVSALHPSHYPPNHIELLVHLDPAGRQVLTQCFHVPLTILDTNECQLPPSHTMAHQCVAPALCINTIGSYECLCPSAAAAVAWNHNEDRNDLAGITATDDFWHTLQAHFSSSSSSSSSLASLPWEVSLETSPSCPSRFSTRDCCPSDATFAEGQTCRAQFQCPTDPCRSSHDCVSIATCTRASSPLHRPPYTCTCPPGMMGSGKKCRVGMDVTPPRPTVKYDGVTPTEETLRNAFYCSCTKPILDACAGFPKCEGKHEECQVSPHSNTPACVCKDGYVDNGDDYGCVDETPPELRLRNDDNGDGTTFLRQGDVYREYAVDVVDDNAEEYVRSLKIAYSRPLPSNCWTAIGQFHVNYTVATPWTSPPYVRVTRTVVIEDTDECRLDANALSSFQATCPSLVPRCDVDAGAVCHNTIGSYTCQCPPYTGGDGFLPLPFLQKSALGKFVKTEDSDTDEQDVVVPDGYRGGTGCVDNTKPTLELRGPNPKVFRVPQCGGLRGIMVTSGGSGGGGVASGGGGGSASGSGSGSSDVGRSAGNDGGSGGGGGGGGGTSGSGSNYASRYGNEIANMMKLTLGAELCATHAHSNPRPTDCIRATDRTHRGNVDLSGQVQVGDLLPVHHPYKGGGGGGLEWRVPYNVQDAAGNKATTVWRTVVVEEVNVSDLEESLRQQVLLDKDQAIRRAVEDALRDEREMRGGSGAGGGAAAASAAGEAPSRQATQGGGGAAKKGVRPLKGSKTASSTTTTTTTTTTECPKCPDCSNGGFGSSGRNESGGSSSGGGMTLQQCETLCASSYHQDVTKTCLMPESDDHVAWIVVSSPWQAWIWSTWMEPLVGSATTALWIMMACTAICAIVVLRWIWQVFLWGMLPSWKGSTAGLGVEEEEEAAGGMAGSVRYFQSPEPRLPNGGAAAAVAHTSPSNSSSSSSAFVRPTPLTTTSNASGGGSGAGMAPPPPRASISLSSSPSLFSPPSQEGVGRVGLFAMSSNDGSGGNLYGQPITPTSERR